MAKNTVMDLIKFVPRNDQFFFPANSIKIKKHNVLVNLNFYRNYFKTINKH